MKTLVQINTNVGWNSTGRIAEELGRMAIDAGWESYIAYGRRVNGNPQSASRLLRVGNSADIMVHGAATRIFDRHGLASRAATRNFIKRLDEIAPDVVHLHNIHGYYLNYTELFGYLARSGVPVVWTLHDCWPFTGHCAYFDMADCDRWLTGCHHCPLRRLYPGSMLFDRSRDNYADKLRAFTSLSNLHIVAVSEWLHEVKSRSFLSAYPSYVIHNGVELPPIKPRVKSEKIVLAAASKWDVRKGLAALVNLRERLPDDYRIVIIGLSHSQIGSLPDGVDGMLRIGERDVLRSWYERASVFVNPSLSENLPITNLEAQAVGTPVVAFDSGGMRETISPCSGIMVRRGDIDALAMAVRRVVENPDIYSPRACRDHIARSFLRRDNYRAYIDLYESLASKDDVKIPGMVGELS